MLVDGVSKGGNLLLNVGPTGRGTFDPVSAETLTGLGEWMRVHGRSIYGAGPSELTPPPDCRYTQRGDRLYLHLFAWPFEHVHLPGLAGKVALRPAAQRRLGDRLLQQRSRRAGAQHRRWAVSRPARSTLTLPIRQPAVAVPVVELFLA